MNTFFKDLAEQLTDRQEARLSIKKISGDLVIAVTIDFNKEGKVIQMTGTPEEMDNNFLTELKKPIAAAASSFKSNADEVMKEIEEEEEEEKPKAKSSTKKTSTPKKDEKKEKADKKTGKAATKEKELEKDTDNVSTEESSIKEEPAKPDTKKALERYVKEGEVYMKERKYQDAEEAFKIAHELEPENVLVKQKLDNATKWVKAIKNL